MHSLRHARCLLLLLLTLPPLAHAATYTVGTGGTHATLQAALTTAGATPGDHQIHIATGIHIDSVLFVLTTDQRIDVSGGWSGAFAQYDADPSLTILQGDGIDTTLAVHGHLGQLHLENLTLTHPAAQVNQATCLRIQAYDTHVFSLRDSLVRDCEGHGSLFCTGNGVMALGFSSARIELVGNEIRDNRCEPTRTSGDHRVSGYGAGIYASLEGDAHLLLQDNLIENNLTRSYAEQTDGVGLNLSAYADSTAEVSGNRIIGNRVIGQSVGKFTSVNQGFGVLMVAGVFGGNAEIVARGNLIADNRFESTPANGAQAFVEAYGNGRVVLGDSAIVGGVGGFSGLRAGSVEATSTVQLVNLTVADNEGSGINVAYGTGAISLYNSLSDGNGAAVALIPAVELGSNRLDLPAGFVDAAAGDYRLLEGSPALDVGDAAPPGGLGSVDLDGGARVSGPGVDLGAYERTSFVIFRSGFEALP